MPRSNWHDINERITLCRRNRTQDAVITCLKTLFEETGDGMVAFALGEESEKIGEIESAESYYQEAENLFPLPAFKRKATLAIERLSTKSITRPMSLKKPEVLSENGSSKQNEIKLLDYEPRLTLFIVSCTKKKIWDISPSAPEYVPARYAYIGDSFLKFLMWADERQLERRGFIWMILSGKYGFIEPWHPITYYDVPIDEESYFPVTNDFLKNQVKQVRWRRGPDGRWSGYNLNQYSQIVCISCSQSYLNKIINCFPGGDVINRNIE